VSGTVVADVLENSESIRTYKRLLNGEIRNFPPVFFPRQLRKKRISQLMQYLVEHILKITPEEAYEKLDLETLRKYRLDCLLQYVDPFPEWTEQRAIRKLLRAAYPHLPEETLAELVISVYQEVLSGKRKKFPTNYFHGAIGEQRAHICVKYLCEQILGLKPHETPRKITREVLQEYKLKILLNLLYDSPFDLLTSVYPQLTSRDFQD